jgi:hypothetical protein
MSMPTTDYNQQLLCYLQSWRQLLEQWAAMAAGSPFLTAPPIPAGGQFMPPTAPFMPFMPPLPFMPPMPATAPASPVPPASADYTQQLFGHLQAWRQYLEQQASANPGSPTAGTVQQPTAVPASGGANTSPARPPDVPIPPDDPTGSKGVLQSDDHKGSGPIPPKVVARAPSNIQQSQLSDIRFDPAATPFDGPFDSPGERFQMADPATLSARPGAARVISEAPASQAGSAFVSAMNRVGPIAAPQTRPTSLFAHPGRETPSG